MVEKEKSKPPEYLRVKVIPDDPTPDEFDEDDGYFKIDVSKEEIEEIETEV